MKRFSEIRPTVAALAISVVVLASIMNAAVSVVGNFWNGGDNTLSLVPGYVKASLGTCEEPVRAEPGDPSRLVVLRIDDPQAFVWTDVVRRMVGDASLRGWKTVLGIIPNRLEEDHDFSFYLKENACRFEVAQHGFAHHRDGDYDLPEFDDISLSEAREKLVKGRAILERVTGTAVRTFIPPQNTIDPEIEHVFEETGYSLISRYGSGPYDSDISTYEFQAGYMVPVPDILEACSWRFDEGEACIIMLHPQDYATDGSLDEEKYRSYIELLDGIEAMNASVLTLQELQELRWSRL